MTAFIRLKDALDALPLSLSRLYAVASAARRGRSDVTWLTRERPGAPRGRELWVSVEQAAAWFAARGNVEVGRELRRIAARRYVCKEIAAR
jgi:hypothetical protein